MGSKNDLFQTNSNQIGESLSISKLYLFYLYMYITIYDLYYCTCNSEKRNFPVGKPS